MKGIKVFKFIDGFCCFVFLTVALLLRIASDSVFCKQALGFISYRPVFFQDDLSIFAISYFSNKPINSL